MKKNSVINLIKYHTEHNEPGFRAESLAIADEFDRGGDEPLARYISELLSDTATFAPDLDDRAPKFLEELPYSEAPLPFPIEIRDDLLGIVSTLRRDVGIYKFLLQGPPGTGKTESVRQISRILDRKLYRVDFTQLVDSRLGQTLKNITELFEIINALKHPERVVILLDEIDVIALDRLSSHDHREMGRAESILFRELDRLKPGLVLMATTNLYARFDKALRRRFDVVVDFDRYSKDDLIEIALVLHDHFIKRYGQEKQDKKLFGKMVALCPKLPFPGELKNIISSAIAFGDTKDPEGYIHRIYTQIYIDSEGRVMTDTGYLRQMKCTDMEINVMLGKDKKHSAEYDRSEWIPQPLPNSWPK